MTYEQYSSNKGDCCLRPHKSIEKARENTMAGTAKLAKMAADPRVMARIQDSMTALTEPCILNLDHIYVLITLYRENIGKNAGINKYAHDILAAKGKRDPNIKRKFAIPHTIGFYQIFDSYREFILSDDDAENLVWLGENKIDIQYGKDALIPLSDLYKKFTDGEHDDQMLKLEEMLFKIFLNAVSTKLSLDKYEDDPDKKNKKGKIIKGKTRAQKIKEDTEAVDILKKKAEVVGDGTTSEETNIIAGLARKVKQRVQSSGLADDGDEITLDKVTNGIFPMAMELMKDQNVQNAVSGIIGEIAQNGFDPQQILKQVSDTVKTVDAQEEEAKKLGVDEEEDGDDDEEQGDEEGDRNEDDDEDIEDDG